MSYDDQIEKVKYLRNRIAASLVRSGIYPDNLTINKRLESVDTKLALFQYTNVQESKNFDVEKANTDFLLIYHDLLILYQLVYKYHFEKYEALRAYVDTHLSELETLASKYESRTNFETANTNLGNTVFFQTSGFDMTMNNSVATIDLGKISLNKGSKAAFFIEGNYFQEANVKFYLGDDLICNPYSIQNNTITIPGEASYNTYTCNFSDDVTQNSMFVLNGTAFTPNQQDKYIVYTGKNKVKVTTNSTTSYEDKSTNTAITEYKSGRITFYLLNATYISFDMSKAPLSRNFSGYKIDSPAPHQKITFEYEGTFTFNFSTDGDVYAEKATGIVKDNELYYPTAVTFTDFFIEEYTGEDAAEYSLKTIITDCNSEHIPYISMITVKEIDTVSEVAGQ